jgi:transcriptional regulator with XRE-family HTH domain
MMRVGVASSEPRVSPFGALLRQHRQASGLSQEELAECAKMSRRGVSDLERGVRRRPYPATMRRLSESLGLFGDVRAVFLMVGGGASSVPLGAPAREACVSDDSRSRSYQPERPWAAG